MDFNIGRQKLLLELIRDNTQNTYPVLNDDNIKERIYKYLLLSTKYKDKKKEGLELSENEFRNLNKLHQYFYGTDFDEETSVNVSYSNLYDNFKLTFAEIEKLMSEIDTYNSDIIKTVLQILSVHFETGDKSKKNEIINTYLKQVILPSLLQYNISYEKGDGTITEIENTKNKQLLSQIKSEYKSQKQEEEKKEKERLKLEEDKQKDLIEKRKQREEQERKDKQKQFEDLKELKTKQEVDLKNQWRETLKNLVIFINKNKILPPITHPLGKWLNEQSYDYKNNRNLMKEQDIRNEWEKFISEYYSYFKKQEDEQAAAAAKAAAEEAAKVAAKQGTTEETAEKKEEEEQKGKQEEQKDKYLFLILYDLLYEYSKYDYDYDDNLSLKQTLII